MTIILLIWWSLARDNQLVPSSWQATPLGPAPSSPQRLIAAVLESAGLTRSVPVSGSTEEVEAGKPSPAGSAG